MASLRGRSRRARPRRRTRPEGRSSARGYYHLTEKRIRVEAGLEPNARLRTLLHEGAHALVAAEAERDDDAPRLSYAEEECEVAGHVAAGALGLDTSGEAVPYVAGWGENDALGAVERAAALVDRIAGWLERAALANEADGPAVEPRRIRDPHPRAGV